MRVSPYLWCGSALLVALVLSLTLGSEPFPLEDIGRTLLRGFGLLESSPETETDDKIFFGLRLPGSVLMLLVGAALGGSGAAYQGLLRNPLADPYLIGVAPGAALGLVTALSVFRALPISPEITTLAASLPVAAFLGAILTVFVVYRIARVDSSAPVTTLILAGVAIGAFATALTWFLMLQTEYNSNRIVLFMLGGYSQGGWPPVLTALPYIGTGLIIIILLARPLNVLQFGEEQALQMGLPVERVKLVLILAASLAAAASVAVAGIIGFVGLVVPHVIRIIWGPDYRRLIPLATLTGATTLLVADTITRAVASVRVLPVGIVTALMGVPFFIYLLRREKRSYW
jgi:iron complex transport system permease protein